RTPRASPALTPFTAGLRELYRQLATMPLEIQPMTESDIPTFVAIFMAAFEGGISRILRTTPTPTPESIASNEERFLKALREDSIAHFAKCVDSDTGEVVAGAKWNFYSEGRTEAELQKALELPS
ncbi:hypothetical protein LTR04_001553, partial [Oleoguttula sp. CCFEE 6159]